MATIVTNLTCELTGAVQVKVLQGNLFSADNAGNTINVFVTNNGQPATLGGTISANVIRGDGTTVAVSGAIDGNRAYIILPQACYAIPGVVQIIIKNTESSTTTTIAAVVANVYESTTDTVVDPGNIIPSVAALVEAIEDAVAEIPAGYNACFAPAYSTSSTYALGQYVTYSGYLYRCTTAITSSESWTAAHWTQVALANDVSSLKSAIEAEQEINETEITLAYDDYEVRKRSMTGTGGWNTPTSSSPVRSAVVRIPDGCTKVRITTPGTYTCYFAFLSSDAGYSDGSGTPPQFSAEYPGRMSETNETDTIYPVYSDVKFIYFYCVTSGGDSCVPGIKYYIDAKESIELLLKNESVVLANGTVSSQAVSSGGEWTTNSGSFKSSCVRIPEGTKTVEITPKNGTTIAFLKNLTNRRDGGACSFADGYSARISFTSTAEKKYIIGTDCKWFFTSTSKVDGTDAAPTVVFKPDILRNGDMPDIEEYTNGKFYEIMPTLYEGWFDWILKFSYLSGGGTNYASGFATTKPIPVVPGNQVVNLSADEDDDEHPISFYIVEFNGDTFVRRYAFASGEQYVVPSGVTAIRFMFGFASATGVEISKVLLSEYFAVKFLSVAAQNDFETPTYIAYGASTTEGAVHRFTQAGLTYSPYAYPDYICRALNLRGYNHGHGSTGFLARAGASGPNIMDSIYADGDLLAKASLVTIMFGYGNDRGAGLLIGLYDDYYPYDAEGYHPSGADGEAEMLSKGATLMGCLNWCIKWISEHYPTVTLVVVFGSPSANEDRTVSVVTNPDETAGRPPYKLSVTQPYVDNDPQPYSVPSTGAKGIAQIKTEIDKLKAALNIPIVDMFFDGYNINYYNTFAKNDDGKYAIFSTTGDAEDQTTWEWNSHPNDAGYKMYAQFIAGRVIALYKH